MIRQAIGTAPPSSGPQTADSHRRPGRQMTGKTLNERLAESKGEPFEYEGVTVHGIYRCEVHPDDIVQVRFVRRTPTIRQGLQLKINRGRLLVNGQSSKSGVLWMDTAPGVVEIVCNPPRRGATLSVWNAWERDGIMHAWLGNAGMVFEQRDDAIILKCSDGVGNPDFQDLVVELRLVHRHENS